MKKPKVRIIVNKWKGNLYLAKLTTTHLGEIERMDFSPQGLAETKNGAIQTLKTRLEQIIEGKKEHIKILENFVKLTENHSECDKIKIDY